jgi:U4/U6.U5 tri-snRNP-associated protein 1
MSEDRAENFEVSDYATEETSFKKKVRQMEGVCTPWTARKTLTPRKPGAHHKQKKKAKRSTRRAEADDDVVNGDGNGNGEDVDMTTAPRQRLDRATQDNLVDDDDLQMALARQRRQNAKKIIRKRPEDIAQQGW